jgi:hypothetical protein
MSVVLVLASVLLVGWAVVDEFLKGRRWEALGWLASGLLLAVFALSGQVNAERWVQSIPLTLFMMLSLTLAWRSLIRQWRGE